MIGVRIRKEKNKRVIEFSVYKSLLVVFVISVLIGFAYFLIKTFVIPIGRVEQVSSLIMYGDLNHDNKWNEKDSELLRKFASNPWSASRLNAFQIDINRNGIIENEDIEILKSLYSTHNPHDTYEQLSKISVTPKPREMFSYLPKSQYIQRPVVLLESDLLSKGEMSFLSPIKDKKVSSYYEKKLFEEIYTEALRFSINYKVRINDLTNIEKEQVRLSFLLAKDLYENEQYYDLLIHLILWSEASETLFVENQSTELLNIRMLAYDLRDYVISERYSDFKNSKLKWDEVSKDLEVILFKRLGKQYVLNSMESPRDLTNIQNYKDRLVWQYYKSSNQAEQFYELLNYAQHDRRYLRAVSRTTRKHADTALLNHNVPMMLLLRESIRISNGDKKLAVGLLDETIRIPFAWVKSLPKGSLPSSIALENFLLPGNMEDGSDKSRHWNVFGGLSLYRSPIDSFELALKREIMDVRSGDYNKELVTEFIRDMIANCFGIYHVVAFTSPQIIPE